MEAARGGGKIKDMNKKYLVWGLVALVAGALFFLLFGGGDPQTALGEDVKLVVYTVDDEPTGGAALSVPFIKDSEDAGAVNAVLDIDGDGAFSETEWVVRNESPRVYAEYRNNFNFSAEGVEVGRSYTALVLISKEPVEDKAEFDATGAKELEIVVTEHKMPVSFYEDPSGEIWFGGAGGSFSAAPLALAHEGESLDVFVPDVPNLPQGVNECGPVSVANGVVDLVNKNGDLDEFVEGEFEGNIFDAIEELKKDMGHDPAKGVKPGDIVPGKEAFVKRHNLPIVTETISFPTIEKISEVLKSGAAVEVGMSLGGAGHIVTAVGVHTNADGSMDLQVHDGATSNGMEGLDLTGDVEVQLPDGRRANAEGIHYPHWQGSPQFINWIIVERWVVPETEEQTGVAPSGGDNPYSEADRPSEVEMFVLAPNEYYPKYQFIVAGPDACKSDHYHKHTMAYGVWINPQDPYDFRPISRTDPAPGACGFGEVGSVPVEMRWITWDMSIELLKNLPDDEAQSGGSVEVRGLEGLRGN